MHNKHITVAEVKEATINLTAITRELERQLEAFEQYLEKLGVNEQDRSEIVTCSLTTVLQCRKARRFFN